MSGGEISPASHQIPELRVDVLPSVPEIEHPGQVIYSGRRQTQLGRREAKIVGDARARVQHAVAEPDAL